jgi:hypothetical protein
MMLYKGTILFDSGDLGAINNLVEEGIIKTLQLRPHQEIVKPDPRKFAAEIRAGHHHHYDHGNGRAGGLRALECVLAIMQGKPNADWDVTDVGIYLEEGYGKKPKTASAVLSVFAKHGYAEWVSTQKYRLTEKGKSHPQTEPLPFGYTGTFEYANVNAEEPE